MNHTSEAANAYASYAAWGDSQPPEFITILEITSPSAKYIAIADKSRQLTALDPLYYWNQPDNKVTGLDGWVGQLLIFSIKDKDKVLAALQPAVFITKKVYVPRFEEEAWQKANTILKDFS